MLCQSQLIHRAFNGYCQLIGHLEVLRAGSLTRFRPRTVSRFREGGAEDVLWCAPVWPLIVGAWRGSKAVTDASPTNFRSKPATTGTGRCGEDADIFLSRCLAIS